MSVQLPTFTNAEQLLDTDYADPGYLATLAREQHSRYLDNMIKGVAGCTNWYIRCYNGYELAKRSKARYGPYHYKVMLTTVSPKHNTAQHRCIMKVTHANPAWRN